MPHPSSTARALACGALVSLSLAACRSNSSAADLAFRDALTTPPAGWTGPVFELSHDFPTQNPGPCPTSTCGWLGVDVDMDTDLTKPPPEWATGKWNDYVMSILDYVKEGQAPQFGNEPGFVVKVDGQTRWFHVPWMTYDDTFGREFIHGTTNERTAHLSELIGGPQMFGKSELAGAAATCKAEYPNGFETWSVGAYNEWGGYVLGKIFPSSGVPQTQLVNGSTVPAGMPFPEGTVVVKFLTTNAPVECVPFLKGSPEWQVNRHVMDKGAYQCTRQPQTDRLLQMDVAVVDRRSPTRWVYGTFVYDGNASGSTFWDRLVPLGLQWGSDPWTFPAVPLAESKPLRQTVLNPGVDIFEHEGCGGRLAGPVDNPRSSCMSCHASAFGAPIGSPGIMGVNVPASFGFDGICTDFSEANADYYQNSPLPQGYHGGQFPDAIPLDTSLQVEVALTDYGWFASSGKPQTCTNQ